MQNKIVCYETLLLRLPNWIDHWNVPKISFNEYTLKKKGKKKERKIKKERGREKEGRKRKKEKEEGREYKGERERKEGRGEERKKKKGTNLKNESGEFYVVFLSNLDNIF